uniref:hypothetical protein n=1 Tax=Cephaleuros parasiticus TaxID=173370 RepID=UPI001EE10B32|nr:hypothetical protein MFQ79_pgp087 [Cephaleuros parasiticus]UIB38975.1 hypothetical protein [Cephaleuros parasiticus]
MCSSESMRASQFFKSRGPHTFRLHKYKSVQKRKTRESLLMKKNLEYSYGESIFQKTRTPVINDRGPIFSALIDHNLFFYQSSAGGPLSYSSEFLIPVQISDQLSKKLYLRWLLLVDLLIQTKRGHFIVNGYPKTIIHQIIRSPGI